MHLTHSPTRPHRLTAAANPAAGRHNQAEGGQPDRDHVRLVQGVEGFVQPVALPREGEGRGVRQLLRQEGWWVGGIVGFGGWG